jgi:hypothetical protein
MTPLRSTQETSNMAPRRLLAFESKDQPLLGPKAFARRAGRHVSVASLLIALSLGAGMFGYWQFEHMGWRDAFANAAMLLSGMGPLEQRLSPDGKVFAGLYALYCGLAVIVAVGIIAAPIVHRVLHRFHLESERDE